MTIWPAQYDVPLEASRFAMQLAVPAVVRRVRAEEEAAEHQKARWEEDRQRAMTKSQSQLSDILRVGDDPPGARRRF